MSCEVGLSILDSKQSKHSGKHCVRVLIGLLMLITGVLWIVLFDPPTLITSLLVWIGLAILVWGVIGGILDSRRKENDQ